MKGSIFPCLYFCEVEQADQAVVKLRMDWLRMCATASQEEFALNLCQLEPENSFDDTCTAKSSDKEWLHMEQRVCAKKVCANWAHRAKIFKEYGIAFEHRRSKKEETIRFKFPHEEVWSYVGEEDVYVMLAQHAFPLLQKKKKIKL